MLCHSQIQESRGTPQASRLSLVAIPLILVLAGCPGEGRRDVLVDGDQRTYFVSTPSSYDGETPLPVLLAFHGAFRLAPEFRNDISMDAAAERAGFIVVYPQAKGTFWHPVGEVPGDADDVAFVGALLDELERDYAIDTDHVYATGLSLGGLMTYRLASEFPDRIAGIAPVAAGGMPVSLRDSVKGLTDLPFMAIHGDADPMLPYDGRPGNALFNFIFPLSSVDETFALLSENITCWRELIRKDMPDVATNDRTTTSVLEFVNCDNVATVALFTVRGGGHTWPGSIREQPIRSGPTSKDYNASDAILDFFSQFVSSDAGDRTHNGD